MVIDYIVIASLSSLRLWHAFLRGRQVHVRAFRVILYLWPVPGTAVTRYYKVQVELILYILNFFAKFMDTVLRS